MNGTSSQLASSVEPAPNIKQKKQSKRNSTKSIRNHRIKTQQNGITFTTFAYEIKCIAADTEGVCNYISSTGQHIDVPLMKHKWKYSNPEVYINGIRKQNEFIRNIRTIPLYGITSNEMTNLQESLQSNTNIINISPTAKTTEHGRWNIYTKTTNFADTTKWLTDNIQKMYNDHCKDNISDADAPNHFTPEIRFNSTISFQTRNKDPHLDSASSSVSKYSSSQANSWASVVSGYHGYSVTNKPTVINDYNGYSIMNKSTSKATSSISSLSEIAKTLQTITSTIQKICKRLDHIEERLAAQEQALQQIQKLETETRFNTEEPSIEQPAQYDTSNISPADTLSNTIRQLEERMNARKSELSYDHMTPNKRQDIKKTPTKTKY